MLDLLFPEFCFLCFLIAAYCLDTSPFETLIYVGLGYLVFSNLYSFSFLFVVEAIGLNISYHLSIC